VIVAAFTTVGVCLVGCGTLLGWWLRGDQVDAAYWSGYRHTLGALGTIYGIRTP